MTIQCYICDKDVEIDSIVKHLRSHTDLEARIAIRRGRLPPLAPHDNPAESEEKTDAE